MVTVAECQRVQTNWFRFRAETCGGAVWADGPLTWIDGPDGLNLMFPIQMSAAGVLRGIEHAAIHEREEVRSTTMLCALVGWGFDGVLWTLKGLATQVRDGQRGGSAAGT